MKLIAEKEAYFTIYHHTITFSNVTISDNQISTDLIKIDGK